MKIPIGITVCTLMITLCSCGPSARDLEVQRLGKIVKTLQGQMVAQDHRLETLTNKVIVIKEARLTGGSQRAGIERELQVVRLTPDDLSEADDLTSPVEEDEPIVLRLRGTPKQETLAVVAVAAPPSITSRQTMAAVQTPERKLFIEALERHGAGELDQAGALFEKLLGKFPRSTHAPSAHYWLGECHYESSRPLVAIAHYERVFTDYPNHTKAAGALLKTGLSYKTMKRVDDARITFSVLLSRYPQSAEAELARAHLGSIQGGGS